VFKRQEDVQAFGSKEVYYLVKRRNQKYVWFRERDSTPGVWNEALVDCPRRILNKEQHFTPRLKVKPVIFTVKEDGYEWKVTQLGVFFDDEYGKDILLDDEYRLEAGGS
jgi:hypothetical protein